MFLGSVLCDQLVLATFFPNFGHDGL